MRVLAVETSGAVGSVALRCDGRLVAERRSEPARGHGKSVLAEVDALLSDAAFTPQSLDLLVASSGPGSFTGVRVGLATVRAMGWALGRPVTAFGSLYALAHNGLEHGGLLAPVLDARKREVYGALYRLEGGALIELIQASVMAPAAWRDAVLRAGQGAPITWLGSGVAAFPELFQDAGVDPWIRAATLARLGEAALQAGGPDRLTPATPRYTRPSEAEVKFGPAPEHDPINAIDAES